ncbi:MAG: EamA family transporter [Actinomycetales bacterium]|nr:EamA family transporter [Actinomycetales bacterium]
MYAALALLSSLMWGTADFLGGSVSRRLPALAVYGISQVAGFVVLVAVATGTGAWSTDPGYWPWAIASSVLGLVGMVAFYSALAIGPMGIVSPLVSLSVVVPVAVALLGGELPSSLQVLGILAATIGILLASGPELSGAESARPLAFAGVAALAFGGMFVFMARGSEVSALMTMTGMRVTSVVMFIPIAMIARSFGGATRRDLLPLAAVGVLDATANVLYGVATTIGLLSTTAVLGSLYPVVTAVLAAALLHERLRPVQYAGVAVALAGVLMISATA